MRDKLFNEILSSIFANAVNIGTGLILLLAATSMRAGTFTVGDFALFVYYLGWISEFTAMFGIVLTRYRQAGVSFERMVTLLQGAPPQSLVAHGPVYMRGTLPAIPVPPRDSADRLQTLEAAGLTFRYPGSARGIAGIDLRLERGSVHGDHRADRIGQDHAAARAAGAAAARRGRRFAGTARRSATRPSSSSRRAAPTPRRCRACSAIRCATTC